jgi:hypothetical protein
MRNIVLLFITFIFISCNSHKKDKVVFISLLPWVNWDSLGIPQIVVRQYAEFSLSTKDSIVISKLEKTNNDNYKRRPKYGLENFYHFKINDKFVKSMTKVLNGDLEKTYKRTLGKEYIDDRHWNYIIIIRDNFFKVIPYEHDLLPVELKQIDDSVDKYTNLTSLAHYKDNYTLETIIRLHDSIIKILPPPRLKSTLKFTPPLLKVEKGNKLNENQTPSP